MFAGPHAYERFMGRWSRALAPLLVEFAEVADGNAVLDVGSGTGALGGAVTAAAATRRTVGVELSESYVAFARACHPGVRFVRGDAEHLPFADGCFDRTLSLLTLNFVRETSTAARDMARVTTRGGIVSAAVWDYADGMEMLRVFWDEAVALDPAFDSRDERHMPLCRRGELAALWRDRGLENVAETALTLEMRFPSFEDYWQPFLEGQGPAGALAASLSSGKRNALRVRLRRRLLGDDDRPIVIGARAWAVRGTVPSP